MTKSIFDYMESDKDKFAQRERTDRKQLLDEYAEYLQELTTIDSLLYQFEMQDDDEDLALRLDEDLALRLIRKMRAAMPTSIVATRREER